MLSLKAQGNYQTEVIQTYHYIQRIYVTRLTKPVMTGEESLQGLSSIGNNRMNEMYRKVPS